MDEKRIEQVLEMENQAQAVHEAALREAEQLPKQAERDAQAQIEAARAAAEEEARRVIERAHSEDESKRILAQAESKAQGIEALALSNLERGVAFVLSRVTGRE